ncbi:F-box protein At5g07610-like [Lycium ferocissimum]|uniref:F-box protein At5g07610-like n=1 Tax=Lycium ferocissimum TaxID=112874 RepID=UPI0028150218|nr:F-box protein At5g07610-like [Lycium ferocissimum]XP_059308485.1 F-box protein At5g07610-like [Lycium ferocissimum]
MASSEHIKSAEAVERSDDLVVKILLLLPARPLFRFKLVSKRWQSLISDPYFSSLWRPLTFPSALIARNLSWSFGNKCDNFSYIPLKDAAAVEDSPHGLLDFLKGDSFTYTVEIMSSCGGLLFCCCYKPWIREYYVCNPTTKQFTLLPSPDRHYSRDLCLAFDPSKSPHYKILNVGFHYNEMYSSETNSWRQLRDPFPRQILFHLREDEDTGVFFNGAIFWVLARSFCYFDMDKEILHSDYPMPEMDITFTDYWFGCVDERLYLVGHSDRGWIRGFDVFELGNDYSWSLKYHVDPVLEVQSSILSVMTREGNDQELFMAVYVPYQVKFINLKDNTCNMVLPIHASVGLTFASRVYHLIENPFLAI